MNTFISYLAFAPSSLSLTPQPTLSYIIYPVKNSERGSKIFCAKVIACPKMVLVPRPFGKETTSSPMLETEM